ncbi:MAG TPA: class F sortase [Kineosporiaceae bacterium]|nr:class F sortase [Kineosporiaceae bacterium]
MTVRPREWSLFKGRSLAGLIAVLVVLGFGLLAVGLRSPDRVPPSQDLRTGMPVPAPAVAEASSAPVAAPPRGKVRALPRSVPVQLDIPAIKVHTRVMSLGLKPDSTVEVPPLERDAPAGWYRYLASPGEIGPAVILGHVDSARDGPAVFYRLGLMRRGNTIKVTRADGVVAVFTVQSVVEVDKSAFPTDAVYGPTRTADLRLVTCGGSFDRSRHSYRDNIIVFATLRSSRS